MRALAAIVLVSLAGVASAQPAVEVKLDVDDCPKPDGALTQQDLIKRGGERFERGNTLYLQGDYLGSVKELVGAYCTIPFPTILRNIGQSYERLLEYEKAIAYLQRYADTLTPQSPRESDCAPEPMVEKQNTLRRIEVLKRLEAHLFVETSPPDARVSIMARERRAAYGESGKDILVAGGTYEMIVEKVGHKTEKRTISVKIGKPYTFYVELKKLEGRLSIQTTPADARVFLDKRFVGIGRAVEDLPATKYHLLVEAPGREEHQETIEVLPNRENRLNIELRPKPQFARRQLIVYAGIGGAVATGSLLYAFEDTSIATAGSLAGIGAGLLGSYVFLPDEVPLGTANLTITSSVATGVLGASATLAFTEDQAIVEPILGASLVLGAGAGYLFAERTKITPGDAALLNTTMLWGTAAGLGFAVSFGSGRELTSGLVLSGLGMGAVGGLLMTNYYDISRTHAALIDVGGIVGVIGGLAAESLAYREDQNTAREEEHAANFALGGMAIGLILAGVLTRNFDEPKVPVTPALGTTKNADGTSSMTYGLRGVW